MVTKIGLDLGYANITLSDSSSVVYREPSIALIDKESRRIVAVGDSASEIFDGSDKNVLVRPFKNGLLFDHKITQSVISNALRSVVSKDRIRCIVGIPSDFTPKDEKELFAMINFAGVNDCYAVNRAIAALIGAGYSPNMSVISVNIGASKTDVAVLNDGEIAQSVTLNVGGEDFDKVVKQYIFEQGDVNVSLSVARAIKEKLGSVWAGKEDESVEIEGVLSLTGNKVKMTVSTEDIVGVFEKPLYDLLRGVAEVIKKIPLDCVEKTFENGIVLTGGGALLYGLDMMMNKVLDIPVTMPRDALDCVAKGLARINNFIPVKGRASCKNITSKVSKYYEEAKV